MCDDSLIVRKQRWEYGILDSRHLQLAGREILKKASIYWVNTWYVEVFLSTLKYTYKLVYMYILRLLHYFRYSSGSVIYSSKILIYYYLKVPWCRNLHSKNFKCKLLQIALEHLHVLVWSLTRYFSNSNILIFLTTLHYSIIIWTVTQK